jgi:hypothetical protein
LLQDAVWVLPATPRTREEFEWLAVEIGEQGGEASVWEGHLTLAGQDEALVRQFLAQVETEYAALRDAVASPDVDLAALSRRYQQVQGQDYFQSALGQQVRAALLAARGEQDA